MAEKLAEGKEVHEEIDEKVDQILEAIEALAERIDAKDGRVIDTMRQLTQKITQEAVECRNITRGVGSEVDKIMLKIDGLVQLARQAASAANHAASAPNKEGMSQRNSCKRSNKAAKRGFSN